jgi:polyisoprenoid-binding protein YceI
VSAPTALATGRYTLVAQRCAVRFTARGFGLPVRGAFSVRSGEVRSDTDGTTVTAVLDAASFHTRSARRDRDVRSARFLDVERFPNIVVTGRWAGPGAPLPASVTVKDVAAPVDVAIDDVERSAHRVVVRASARIDRRAFGVGPVHGPVGRWIDIELEIVLVPG